MFRASFPDLRMSVEDLVAEGDRVAARVILTGTHTGEPFLGIAAERQPGERRAVPLRAVQRRRPRCRPLGRGRRRRPHAPARRHHRAQPELSRLPGSSRRAHEQLSGGRGKVSESAPHPGALMAPRPAPPARGRRRRPRSRVGVRPLDARAPPAGAEVPRRRRRRRGRGRVRQHNNSADSNAASTTVDDRRHGSSSTTSTSTGSGSSTTPIPEETAGPFPGDGTNGPNVLTESGIVRRDIRSSFGSASGTAAGVPRRSKLTVLDSATGGAPLAAPPSTCGTATATGNYSMYSQGATDQNYLRGVQEAGRDGSVTFTTIFPAAYSGRWPHMHFEVYPSLAEATSGRHTGRDLAARAARGLVQPRLRHRRLRAERHEPGPYVARRPTWSSATASRNRRRRSPATSPTA